jgi:hypothetical protein
MRAADIERATPRHHPRPCPRRLAPTPPANDLAAIRVPVLKNIAQLAPLVKVVRAAKEPPKKTA